MTPVTEVKTNPNPAPESDLEARTQCIQDNLRMMHAYFDALFTKDLNPMLAMFDQDIEWLIVPTGDTIKRKIKSPSWQRTTGRRHRAGSKPS
jgi:ketosteroid isomerase-like protein